MEQQFFCDGIGKITVIGGIVRLDLMAFSPLEGDPSGQPRAVTTHRVAMSMEGFLRATEKIVQAAKQLSQLPTPSVPAAAPPDVARDTPASHAVAQPVQSAATAMPTSPTPASPPPLARRPFP